MTKALIAMSGGVDSSMAAKMMVDRGFECIGCTMKLYNNEDACVAKDHSCCSLEDVQDARGIADNLGIPYYVFNFTEDFREKIINKFVNSYLNGRTPNPCIDCNRYMKFDRLYNRAQQFDCECVVTGHYARIEFDGERYHLKKALDDTKDQSYVLYTMTQEQLSRTYFPLGELTKKEVRALAAKHGFENAAKPDSQDICFVPDGNYAAVIEKISGKAIKPGRFIMKDGKVMGKHAGIIHYTIGQRRGLGLTYHEPLYVCRIDPITADIILGREEDCKSTEAHVSQFNWISGVVPSEPIRCAAKVRYRQKEKPVTVYPDGPNAVRLVFDEPLLAITPGQAAVLYDGDEVIGGGTID